jgi:hypothetical protein
VQPALGRYLHAFAAPRMAATAVRPVVGPQTLVAAALLQQQFARIIEQEQRKCPVQHTGTVMALAFREKADLVVLSINQDQLFTLRRNDSVMRAHYFSTMTR